MGKQQVYGSGSIFERKNRRGEVIGYRGQLSLGGERRSFLGDTKREVQQLMAEAAVAYRQGRLGPRQSATVKSYLEDTWLPTIRNAIKPSTQATYELNVRRIVAYLGNTKLDALKPVHIQRFYTLLRDEKRLSAQTIRQVHMTLHKTLHDALRRDLLHRNPADLVTLPRADHKEMHRYTAQELDALFRATAVDRLHALWVVLGTGGLRLGEALGLQRSDIDCDRRTLTVRRSLQRGGSGGGLVFLQPKTKRSRRTIELSDEAVQALKLHEERQEFERRTVRGGWEDNDLVFPSEAGTPLEQSRVHRHWSRATAKAGAPHYRIHDLRHTVATLLSMAGMNVKTVSDILGHATASMTMDRYGHVIPASRREAATSMDGLLAQQRGAV